MSPVLWSLYVLGDRVLFVLPLILRCQHD
jgi:hypothetical protein